MSKLTIGMATFRDFDGVYFSLQALHVYHPRVEYLVIDNAPESSTQTRDVTNAVGGRYLHRPDLNGTSAPRDALFRLAKTQWVMCIDSHVLLESGAVQYLLDYIDANPNSNDLISGPLIYDDGKNVSTHWRADNVPGLWGTWDTDPRGFGDKPFEIPMQGLGLFAMRRAAWPGFHPKFRGFGGEEGYIHEKVRQRGGKNWCLPKLRWRHRFRHMENGAPPPPYHLSREDHIWNLLLGHRELGIDAIGQIRQTFGNGLPAGVFDQLAAKAEMVQPWHKSSSRKRRMSLLGVWYTNSQAPLSLMQKSLQTIKRAADETMHHNVRVVTSSWLPIAGNSFPCVVGKPDAASGHASIIAQMRAAVDSVQWHNEYVFDAVVFLEHDVLYPPGYFDKIGDAFDGGEVPVVSNLDYEGLNATGWLAVKERHEPNHQLALRRDVFFANLDRAQAECDKQGWCLLEPQGDRNDWVRLPPVGLTPAIHVNWT
jgi:hypothetical protein